MAKVKVKNRKSLRIAKTKLHKNVGFGKTKHSHTAKKLPTKKSKSLGKKIYKPQKEKIGTKLPKKWGVKDSVNASLFGLNKNTVGIKSVGNIKFMDFCAGIGGGRLGLQNLGLKCVAFSEIDQYAEKTYRELFGNEEKNYGDLTKINPVDLPNFELMIAGFPCQSFSVIGQRKGMNDDRGQIIF